MDGLGEAVGTGDGEDGLGVGAVVAVGTGVAEADAVTEGVGTDGSLAWAGATKMRDAATNPPAANADNFRFDCIQFPKFGVQSLPPALNYCADSGATMPLAIETVLHSRTICR